MLFLTDFTHPFESHLTRHDAEEWVSIVSIPNSWCQRRLTSSIIRNLLQKSNTSFLPSLKRTTLEMIHETQFSHYKGNSPGAWTFEEDWTNLKKLKLVDFFVSVSTSFFKLEPSPTHLSTWLTSVGSFYSCVELDQSQGLRIRVPRICDSGSYAKFDYYKPSISTKYQDRPEIFF